MNKILSLVAACSLFAAPAFADKMAQTHHCDMNGTEVTKTHKDCTKAGGKWAKGAPTMGAPAPGVAAVSANPNGTPPAAPNAGKQSPAPANMDPSRDPKQNPKIPVNTPPTPNGNNSVMPPGDRTPGN